MPNPDPTYYTRAAEGFDKVAAQYDSLYGHQGENPGVIWMKDRNWELVSAALQPVTRLVELGCGTGEDAVRFAQQGKFVLATDLAPAMVSATAQRAESHALTDQIAARVTPSAAIGALAAEFGPASFDGAYSGFTLMYEPDLPAVGRGLALLLHPGAPLVVTVLSQRCLWEVLWWGLRGHPIGAFRRFKRWTKSQIGAGEKLPATYYTPADLRRAFRPHFTLRRATALNLIKPPSFIDPFYQRHAALFDRLLPLEMRLRAWPLLNSLGHAFVAEFERTIT